MIKLSRLVLVTAMSLAGFVLCPHAVQAASAKADQGLKIRFIDFKVCVEKSKLGKHEQAGFEALKKQMETMLGEKEKTLNEMEDKLNDPDYLDSLSPEAETELKRKYRALAQEISQQQNQYLQTLQQANFKILEKLDELIGKASEVVARKNGYHVIYNDDNTFYYDKDLDVSNDIIAMMDELYAKAPTESKGSSKD